MSYLSDVYLYVNVHVYIYMYIYVYIYIDVYIYVYENEFVRLGGAVEGAVTRMSLNRALSVLHICPMCLTYT